MRSQFINVYRLERPDGKGVFSSGAAGDAYDALQAKIEYRSERFDPGRHPSPHDCGQEGLLAATQRRWCFGFTSLAQYRQWFNHAVMRRYLADHTETRLVRYRVPRDAVAYGTLQLAFDRTRAERLEVRSPKLPRD